MSLDEQTRWLSVLARAEASAVKAFTEGLLPALEPHGLEVIENRTGLVMLPATDTAKGTRFYLGEVLVTESLVRLGRHQGYAVCLGRDLEQSLAVAILDAALQAGLGQGQRLRLSGPGIKASSEIWVDAPRGLWLMRRARVSFPLGWDLILVTGEGACICLPRSTQVEVF